MSIKTMRILSFVPIIGAPLFFVTNNRDPYWWTERRIALNAIIHSLSVGASIFIPVIIKQ